MEFLVDRLNEGAITRGERYWRHAENLRLLWDAGIAPPQIRVEAARRSWSRILETDIRIVSLNTRHLKAPSCTPLHAPGDYPVNRRELLNPALQC